jgi:hypothetical protein
VDKFFKTLAKLASRPVFLRAKTENKLAKNLARVSEKKKKPRQTGDWVCIFTRQS